ncbi:MAG: cytochrome C oxidase subunit IV family protein [Rhodobacteraceae bacterium]|jgi:cytochrome c oxidase subunit 4|nr:cytochrome C oxidase subunit IV family protein [Paracoccaceae bacterium]
MAANAEDVRKSIKTYLFVFGALAVLTVVTVGASFLSFKSVAATVALALLIASVKGTLVASFFMHLLEERSALYWILGLCAIFFVAMIMLPVLQTAETDRLIDPVYQAAGEERPVRTAPAHHGADHGGAGDSSGH